MCAAPVPYGILPAAWMTTASVMPFAAWVSFSISWNSG